jgi:hypothetical protein
MKTVAASLMSANAALFFFGSIQHAGVASGRSTNRSSFRPRLWRPCVGFAYCGVRLRFFVVQERDGA